MIKFTKEPEIINKLLYDYRLSCTKYSKSLENQFIYPNPKGSKLILAAPSSHAGACSVLRSPWGRGKRRTGAKRSSTKSKSMNLCA